MKMSKIDLKRLSNQVEKVLYKSESDDITIYLHKDLGTTIDEFVKSLIKEFSNYSTSKLDLDNYQVDYAEDDKLALTFNIIK